MRNLNEHEEKFDIKPVGIRYRCEFCEEGEMKVSDDNPTITLTSYPPMIKHICTKCGKDMLLPKSYPYIEWIPVEDSDKEVSADV